MIAQMEGAKNRLNIVILAACRDNPFARSTRSAARGLAQPRSARGTLIAYATAPGQVAEDGTGTNSNYTRALAQRLGTPGLSLESLFKGVRAEVQKATDGRQTPWESSSITGEFFFVLPDQPPAQMKETSSLGDAETGP